MNCRSNVVPGSCMESFILTKPLSQHIINQVACQDLTDQTSSIDLDIERIPVAYLASFKWHGQGEWTNGGVYSRVICLVVIYSVAMVRSHLDMLHPHKSLGCVV